MNDHQPHPVPRIEIVERIGGIVRQHTDSGVWVEKPDPQPWHVRYIGGNGEPLATSEQLTSRDAAHTNAEALARMFGVVEPQVVGEQLRGLVALVEENRPADVDVTEVRVPVVYVREGDAS